MDFITPFVGTLGFGGLMGYAAGYATKKVAKLALILMGLLFILVQYLVYKHWAHVEWGAIAHAGGVALKHSGAQFWKVITYNLTLGAGFGIGFLLGFRKG